MRIRYNRSYRCQCPNRASSLFYTEVTPVINVKKVKCVNALIGLHPFSTYTELGKMLMQMNSVNALIGLHPFSTPQKLPSRKSKRKCVNALIGLHPFSTVGPWNALL